MNTGKLKSSKVVKLFNDLGLLKNSEDERERLMSAH